MKNNFPTNIAQAMGADVIIGVDVQNDLRTADELNNLGEIFNQIINLTGQTRYEENIKLATVYIKVDVKGYSAASFNIPALDTLMHRGEEAARRAVDCFAQTEERDRSTRRLRCSPTRSVYFFMVRERYICERDHL